MDHKRLVTVVEHNPSAQILEFLEDRIYEHNRDQTGRDDGQLFSIVIRDDTEIIAGIAGWTWAQAAEISTLWVQAHYRHHGYGSQLLQMAEQEALARGCRIMTLASYSFQAPDFYLKHGFQVAFQLEDFPPGYRQVYLVKRLSQENTSSALRDDNF